MFYVCFLSCKYSCVPTALKFPTAKFHRVYCYTFYLISRQVTMYTVSVSVNKPCFVYTIVIFLSGCYRKVSCIGCYCTSCSYMPHLFIISRDYIEANTFILFYICNLKTTVGTTSEFTIKVIEEQFCFCTLCTFTVHFNFCIMVYVIIKYSFHGIKPTSV